MKRSEMVKIIASKLDSGYESEADVLLEELENLGMLPPVRNKVRSEVGIKSWANIEAGEYRPVYKWEPEDETK